MFIDERTALLVGNLSRAQPLVARAGLEIALVVVGVVGALECTITPFGLVEDGNMRDAKVHEAFLHGILSRTAPLYSRLSRLQRAAVKCLAGELGGSLDTLGLNVDLAPADNFSTRLETADRDILFDKGIKSPGESSYRRNWCRPGRSIAVVTMAGPCVLERWLRTSKYWL